MHTNAASNRSVSYSGGDHESTGDESDRDSEIALARPRVEGHGLQRALADADRVAVDTDGKGAERLPALRRLLVHEHHVAQRRAIQPMACVCEIADGRERPGRVRQRVADFLPRSREQFQKRRIAEDPRAARQGSRSSRRIARGRALASGGRRADEECGLSRVAREQRLEDGEQRYERRHAEPRAQIGDPPGEGAIDRSRFTWH